MLKISKVSDSSKAVKALKKMMVKKNVPEFPPTKQYFHKKNRT